MRSRAKNRNSLHIMMTRTKTLSCATSARRSRLNVSVLLLSWTYIPSITGHVISSISITDLLPPFAYSVLVNSQRINEWINKTERQARVCASGMGSTGCNPDEFINPTRTQVGKRYFVLELAGWSRPGKLPA